MRNMRSIGIDLAPWAEQGLLRFRAARPTLSGLEMHLATMLKDIASFDPQVVIVDPLNSFVTVGNEDDVKMMLLRLADALKLRQTTAFFTSLTAGGASMEQTDIAISSLIDTWLLVRDMECAGERNRGLYILKSRGMPHSNQIREFTLTNRGIALREAYIGPSGVLTGSARLAQEAQELAAHTRGEQEISRRQKELSHKRAAMEAHVEALRADFAAHEAAALTVIDEAHASDDLLTRDRHDMAHSRMAEAT
jgi:circadian clock protein KaiC